MFRVVCGFSWPFGYAEKCLTEKADVQFKIYKVTVIGQQTNTTHILPNIPRNKGNQTMKFDQLIEYNMRNWKHFSSVLTWNKKHFSSILKKLSQFLSLVNCCQGLI